MKLLGACIATHSIDAMVGFYTNVFGYEPYSDGPDHRFLAAQLIVFRLDAADAPASTMADTSVTVVMEAPVIASPCAAPIARAGAASSARTSRKQTRSEKHGAMGPGLLRALAMTGDVNPSLVFRVSVPNTLSIGIIPSSPMPSAHNHYTMSAGKDSTAILRNPGGRHKCAPLRLVPHGSFSAIKTRNRTLNFPFSIFNSVR